MIVTYKPKVAHILTVPFRKTGGRESGKPLKAHCKASYRLIPGTNELPDIVWDHISKQKSIKNKIKSGELTSISEVKEEQKEDKNGNKRTKKTEKSKGLGDIDIQDAISLIKDCNDIEVLKGWKKMKGLNEELRMEIINRIEAVEYYIKTGKEKKD